MLIDYHDINQPQAKGKFEIEKLVNQLTLR